MSFTNIVVVKWPVISACSNYYLGESCKMKLFIVIVDVNIAVFGHERDELCRTAESALGVSVGYKTYALADKLGGASRVQPTARHHRAGRR
jgi:hypothetical protein